MSDVAAATRSHYDVLAPTYNQFLSSFSQRVVPALDRLLLGQLPGGASVLDVCCGTGQLASELTKRGLLVTGVDLSAGMLSFARQNAPKAEFLQADVCTMTLPREFDAAVSTFDSLNHLPDRNSLAACFRNVASCLKPGGRFLFDLNMQTGFELRWWGRAQLVVDGLICEIEADYHAGESSARNNIVVRDEAGAARSRFSIVENCWPEDAIRLALNDSGFGSIVVYDGHLDAGLWGEIGRAFFLATAR